MTVKLHINIPVRNTSGLDVTVERPGDDDGTGAAREMIEALKQLRDEIGHDIGLEQRSCVVFEEDVDRLVGEITELYWNLADWIVRLGGEPEEVVV